MFSDSSGDGGMIHDGQQDTERGEMERLGLLGIRRGFWRWNAPFGEARWPLNALGLPLPLRSRAEFLHGGAAASARLGDYERRKG